MENFNGLSSNLQGDFICEDIASNKASLASIYEDDCIAPAKAANILKSNIGTWSWQPLSNESIYTEDKCYGEGETMDEVIERIVKEVVSALTKKGELENAPEIEKYHLKHK